MFPPNGPDGIELPGLCTDHNKDMVVTWPIAAGCEPRRDPGVIALRFAIFGRSIDSPEPEVPQIGRQDAPRLLRHAFLQALIQGGNTRAAWLLLTDSTQPSLARSLPRTDRCAPRG